MPSSSQAPRLAGRWARWFGVPALVLAGCQSAGPSGAASAPASVAEIEALIGQPVCSSDADCGTVAIGARACGGPERYVAWSKQVTDASRLRAAATRYEAQRRAEISNTGLASICSYVADPGAQCTAAGDAPAGGGAAKGRCVLQTSTDFRVPIR